MELQAKAWNIWDITNMELLVTQHKTQYNGFKDIKENEVQMNPVTSDIKQKLEDIQQIQTALFNRLKDAQVIVNNSKDIIFIYRISEDVVKYQSQMLVYAKQDPKLLLVAVKTEQQLVKKTKTLLTDLLTAITATDINLMDNEQRTKLIKHVLIELRRMRGLAYSVCRQMKTARTAGVWKTLQANKFKYNTDQNRVYEILGRYKLN